MEACWKSVLYPDSRLEKKVFSFRPDLQPLKDRIAYLESLRAARQAGPATASGPAAACRRPGDSAGRDNPDWRTYPDLPAEKKAIGEVFSSFRSALKAGDTKRAAACVDESRRETYAALFENRPEAMPSFAALLDAAEMSFLSAPESADPGTTSTLRTSEYAVDVGDSPSTCAGSRWTANGCSSISDRPERRDGAMTMHDRILKKGPQFSRDFCCSRRSLPPTAGASIPTARSIWRR